MLYSFDDIISGKIKSGTVVVDHLGACFGVYNKDEKVYINTPFEKEPCFIDFSKGKNKELRKLKTLTVLSQQSVGEAVIDLSRDNSAPDEDLINLFCCGQIAPNDFFDAIPDYKIIILGRKISGRFEGADFYIPIFYFKFNESLIPLFLYYEYNNDIDKIKSILDSHFVFLTTTSQDLLSLEYLSFLNFSQMSGFLMGSSQYFNLT